MNKTEVRRTLRQRRRDLGPLQRARHAGQICQRLVQLPRIRSSSHLALYIANDSEPDIIDLADLLPGKDRHFYLPCLDSLGRTHMVFRQWRPEDALTLNQFGIPEPRKRAKIIPVWALSVVLMPLVGFDSRGNRLGMGAGYYDRTFILKRGNSSSPPFLIGIAHDCQEVPEIPTDPWDIPLDLIVTEQRTITPTR